MMTGIPEGTGEGQGFHRYSEVHSFNAQLPKGSKGISPISSQERQLDNITELVNKKEASVARVASSESKLPAEEGVNKRVDVKDKEKPSKIAWKDIKDKEEPSKIVWKEVKDREITEMSPEERSELTKDIWRKEFATWEHGLPRPGMTEFIPKERIWREGQRRALAGEDIQFKFKVRPDVYRKAAWRAGGIAPYDKQYMPRTERAKIFKEKKRESKMSPSSRARKELREAFHKKFEGGF